MKGVPTEERTARFQCLMVYLRHAEDPTPVICQGTWEGLILEAPCGENGFGYDPIFFVPTEGCSSAELDPVTKNRLSHRGQALAKLAARSMALQVTVQEGQVWVGDAHTSIEIHPQPLMTPQP